jgi:hypothetical protein
MYPPRKSRLGHGVKLSCWIDIKECLLLVHGVQVELFVDGLEDAQLLVGSGDVATLKLQAQPDSWYLATSSLSAVTVRASFTVGVAIDSPAPLQLPLGLRTSLCFFLHRDSPRP